MAYEKPELTSLSFAGTAVRGGAADSPFAESTDGKMSFAAESGQQSDLISGNGPTPTSSSSGAYEADE